MLQVFSTRNISFFCSINSTIPSFFFGANPFLVFTVSLTFYRWRMISSASLIRAFCLVLNFPLGFLSIDSRISSSSMKFRNSRLGFLQEDVFLSQILKFLFFCFISCFFYFSVSLKRKTSSSLGSLNGLITSAPPC